jgi:hypothetical protein
MICSKMVDIIKHNKKQKTKMPRCGLEKISLKRHENSKKNMDVFNLGNLCSEHIIYQERKEFKSDSYQMFVHLEMKSGLYRVNNSHTSLKLIAMLWRICCDKVKKVKESALYKGASTEEQDEMICDVWITFKNSEKIRLLKTT